MRESNCSENLTFSATLLCGSSVKFWLTAEYSGGFLIRRTLLFSVILLALALAAGNARAQQPDATPPAAADPQPGTQANRPSQSSTDARLNSPKPKNDEHSELEGKQSKRILGIIPNYRSVSVDAQLPPETFKQKFWLATEDTFDYSNFILVGAISGISMAQKSIPEFHQGAAGYGRYYWHSFADTGIGNYMTEAIVPTLTREDPRYYTLGRGGFFKRTGYAVSRLVITRTDSGRATFNISEIVGNGAAAGIANTYYPAKYGTFVKTYQRWGTQVGLDGIFNIAKEFWPDINKAIFHQKY